MIKHCCILYQSDKYEKGKLLSIDESFIDNAITQYVRRFNKQPNRIYAGILIDKDFDIEYIHDESIPHYLLYVGHTEDVDKIHANMQ